MNLNKIKEIVLFLGVILWSFSPHLALASAIDSVEAVEPQVSDISAEENTDINVDIVNVKKPEYLVISTSTHMVTAYSSEAAQTDSSPCITATGFNLCKHGVEDTIAANFLPFGTKVRMPELFGDRIFVVRDRMNARYKTRADIWFKNKNDAIKFGIKKVKIEVLQDNK